MGAPVEPPRPGAILLVCCLAIAVVSIDTTLLNVALPTIRRDYSADLARVQWVLDAYALTLAAFLLLAGAVGDRFGRRRVLQVGLITFAAGAVAAALAPSIDFLVAARILQALGGSMLTPVSIAIITAAYSTKRGRARAIGIWGSVTGISMGVGPAFGGLLVQFGGWPSVFWVPIPIAIAGAVAAGFVVPDTRASRTQPLDPLGHILIAITLTCLVGALIELPGHGIGSPLALAGVGIVAAIAFVIMEGRHPSPAVDLRFLRSIPFTAAGVSAVVAFAAYASYLFAMTFYLQEDRALPPHLAGLMLMPVALTLVVASALSGRLLSVAGPRPVFIVAALGFGGAGAALALIGPETPLLLVAAATIPLGVGFAMVNTPITELALSGMPRSRAGSAAGIMSSNRQVGVALGVAMAGILASGAAPPTLATGQFIVVGSAALLVLALLATGGWGRASAARVAHLLDD